jgi:hypothetical protein
MAVVVVVVGEEDVAECACFFEGGEAAGEDRAVLEGLVVNTNVDRRWSDGASLSAVLFGRWRLLALQSPTPRT